MCEMDRRGFLKATASGLAALPVANDAIGLATIADLLGVRPELPGADDGFLRADYPVRAVPLAAVKITDSLWRPRMEVNRRVSLRHCFDRFEEGDSFNVAKLVEAAAWMLEDRPDAELEAYVDGRVDAMIAAVHRRLENPEQSVRVTGHFFEAAVAWSAVTGRTKALDAAVAAADAMDRVYGPGKKTYISGHEGLKIGLVTLFRATGDERYWKLAKFFADERGRDDWERTGEFARDRTYAQDHEPVIEQDEAVGHCVRATFLYIPMTDIAALAPSAAYRAATERIWRDAVEHKTYVTGGIGSIRFHEQFGAPYELPNLSAWNETCAAYGNAVWNHRMFLLSGDAKYIDVMERVLYNALLAGVSLGGDRFFYQNPLESFGDYTRFEWINVPCCPPNVVRMIASIGSHVYATGAQNDIFVNLFIASTATMKSADTAVTVRQETRYPWDGRILLHVDPERNAALTLNLRIPGWTRDSVLPGDLYAFANRATDPPQLTVNGEPWMGPVESGYARITRTWRAGDTIQLDLPMPVRIITARSEVADDRDRIALQRGPLVYCAEWPDNDGRALDLVVPDDAAFDSAFRPDLLGGVQVVRGTVQAIRRDDGSGEMRTVPHALTAIPYAVWANRGTGEMAVWLARVPAEAWLPPTLPPGVVRVSTSGAVEKSWTGYNDQNDDLGAIHDGHEPINSADQSNRFFRMRPPVGQPAWLQYDFAAPVEISSSRVYFFDDRRFCRLPSSWRLLCREGDRWVPVAARARFAVLKDAWNAVSFDAVRTAAVRIEIEPRTISYRSGEIGPPDAMFIADDIAWREAGVIEWQVS